MKVTLRGDYQEVAVAVQLASAPAGRSDIALLVPERFALIYQRRRNAWTTVDTIAAWLVAGHLLLLLLIVGRGSLYLDDLRAQGYALDQPFLSFVMGSNGTHFAPLPRTLDWIQSRLLPLQHGPAVVVALVVRLLLAAGFWRVLRRLFGPRPLVLVPFVLLLLTPALLPATTYYRQSITVLAATVALVWALDAHLRWVLYRHRADLAGVMIITALGLACYEKAAAIPVILLVATLVLFGGRPEPGPAPSRPAPARAGVFAALLSALVVLVFLVLYRTGPYDQGPAALPSGLDVIELTGRTVGRTIIPLLLGGPFHWDYPVPYAGVPDVGATTVTFCLVIAVVGVAAAFWRAPGRTARASALLLAWTLPSVAIVAAGRFGTLGLDLADAVRLWADLVPGFLLATTLAALPWQIGVRHRPRAAPTGRPAAAPVEITVSALAGALVLLLVLGGSVISSFTYAGAWWDNPTGQWISNARLSLENAEPQARTLATPLPPALMPSFVTETLPTDAPLLLLLRPDLRFHDGDGPTKVMNPAGVRSDYLPMVQVDTQSQDLCKNVLDGREPTTVRLPGPAPYAAGGQIELGLLLSVPTKVKVTVTTANGDVLTPLRFSDDELTKGGHTFRVPAPYQQTVSSISVSAEDGGSTPSCVAYAKVWAPYS